MRLRHKKNAEELILNEEYCINNFFDVNKNYINTNITNESKYFDTNNEIFNNNNDLHLELGVGKGRFIIKNAIKNANINFIGIEKSATILLKTIDTLKYKMNELSNYSNNIFFNKIETINHESANTNRIYNNVSNKTHDLENLRFLCADITYLDKYFDKNSISKIYLNFSDPWPKDRHFKRRLTYREFLIKYYYLLKNEGTIEFKTDQKNLFDFTLEEIKETKFKLIAHTYDLHNDITLNKDNIMTEYEEKFSKLGNKICKLILIKY